MVFIDTDPETGELIFQPEGREEPFRVPPDLIGDLPAVVQSQQSADTGVLPQAQARQAVVPTPQALAVPEVIQTQQPPIEVAVPDVIGAPPVSSEVEGQQFASQADVRTTVEQLTEVDEAAQIVPEIVQPPPRVVDVDGVSQTVESLPPPELPRASSVDLSIQEEADIANLPPEERLRLSADRLEATTRRVAELRSEQEEGVANKADELVQAQNDAQLASEKARNAAAENAVAVRQARQKRVQEIAETEINPERYWANVGTERKILAVISAGLAGFLNPRGGRNPMIEAAQAAIQRDIQAQIQDRGNKERALDRDAVTEERGIADEFGKAEDIENRAALAWTRFGELLKVEAQKFDPELSKAQVEVGLAEVQAQTDRAYANIEQLRFENGIKLADASLRKAKTVEAIATSKTRRSLARSKERRAIAAEKRAQAFEQIKASQIIEKDVIRSPFTGKIIGSVATVDTKVREEVARRFEASATATEKMKQLMLLHKEHGGKYDGPGQKFVQSPEGKLMNKVAKDLIFATAIATKGVISKADLQLAAELNPVNTFFATGAELAQEDNIKSLAAAMRRSFNAIGISGESVEQELLAMPRSPTGALNDNDLVTTAATDVTSRGSASAIAGISSRLDANPTFAFKPGLEKAVRAANRRIQGDPGASVQDKSSARQLTNRTLAKIGQTRESEVVERQRQRVEKKRRQRTGFGPKIPASIRRKRGL